MEEPNEADIVKRPGVFLFNQYNVDVENEEDMSYITIPKPLENTYKVRQEKDRIEDCHFRLRSKGNEIEIRESLLDKPDVMYAYYEKIQFPNGKIPLKFENIKKDFDKVLVNACKDHIMIYPCPKNK